jgi:hypothetical protein
LSGAGIRFLPLLAFDFSLRRRTALVIAARARASNCLENITRLNEDEPHDACVQLPWPVWRTISDEQVVSWALRQKARSWARRRVFAVERSTPRREAPLERWLAQSSRKL